MISNNNNSAQSSGAITMSEGSSITTVAEKPKLKSATVKYHLKERDGSIFTAKTAYETLLEAQKQPDPRKLWKEFWFENEVCCLFADSNVGKSVLAVQIAASISKTDKVLYYDFEQSGKQFQMRYTDPKTKRLYKFSKNFLRLTLPTESLNAMGANMEETIMANIEGDVKGYKAKILIIDNISWLMNARNSTETASNLMKRLVALKKVYGLSILVLAHTKKKAATKPIDQNDLAGSKRLINFFDAAFTIGKSMDDPQIKYLKQIKVRTGQFVYDQDHVLLCTIEQKFSLVQFVEQGFGDEADHLKKPKAQEKAMQMANVKSLKAAGKSIREIAELTGISKSKVDRLLKC